MKNSIFIFLLFVFFQAKSQDCFRSSDNKPFNAISQVLLYADSTGQLSIEKISAKKFMPLNSFQIPRLLGEEFRYNFYLKFCIENPKNTIDTLLMSSGVVKQQEIWKFTSGKWVQTGFTKQSLPENKRPYRFDQKFLKVVLLPKERAVFLLKFNDLTGKEFEINPLVLTAGEEAKIKLKDLYDNRLPMFTNTAMYSILFYILIMAMALYYFLRQRFLVYYALYLISMLLFNIYGFSYSPFIVTPLNFSEILNIDLRQNFYILCTQIFYMLFLSEFLEVNSRGTRNQKSFFRIIIPAFIFLLIVELFLSLILKRYDWQFYNTLISELLILVVSIYLIINLFKWKNLYTPPLLKAASIVLFLGVIFGFISSTLGFSKTSSSILLYYPNYVFNIAVLAEVILYTMAILQQFFQTKTEQIRLQQQYAMSELSLLRSQINPHFLFNTLNSIKNYIIRKDTNQATEYLTEFSDLIRAILEKSREHIISLNEELVFCEHYLRLEQKRAEGKFKYFIDRDLIIDLSATNVPAFILQPFLENAIKHGFNNLNKQGFIKISIFKKSGDLSVVIEDNGIGREEATKNRPAGHQSMGEQLITNRINLISEIYNWSIKVEIEDLKNPTGTKVNIRIPDLR
ncbi:MAG: histidine kinase [Cytophagaceae bacterium]|nr:histidine kinase [Cytophagaceae bacterium]